MFPLMAKSDASEVKLTVQHNAKFGSNYLTVSNPTKRKLAVEFSANDIIHSPAGRFHLQRLSAMGSIDLEPMGSKIFSLDNLDEFIGTASNDLMGSGHHGLRYPIRDNVIIDQVSLGYDYLGAARSTPVYLSQALSVA